MPTDLTTNDNSPTLRKLFNFLLESVSEDGHWHDFDESWNPIITTVTCELLLNAGVKLNYKWYILREQYKPITIGKSLQYLNGQIREDGTFGTDLWDSIRLAKLIASNELKSYFTNYDKLHQYICNSLEKDEFITSESEWRGPAFYACAVDYLDLIKLDEISKKNLDKLLYHQQSDGCWTGVKSKEGQPLLSPVWHTSQAIATLRKKDSEKYKKEIDRAVTWLVDKQENNGSWPAVRQYEIYFTSYAILALINLPSAKNVIDKAVCYIKSKIDSSGKCSDLGGTLMCAIAFWEIYKDRIEKNMTFMEFLLASKTLDVTNQLENQINELGNISKAQADTINSYKDKYKNAEVVLTKTQAYILAIFLALASTFGGIPGVLQVIHGIRGDKIENPPTLEVKKDSISDSIKVIK